MTAALVAHIDRVIEAAVQSRRSQAVAKPQKALRKALAAAFRAQGEAVVKAIPRGIAEARGLREAADDDWLEAALDATADLFLDQLEASVVAGLEAGAAALMDDLGVVDSSFDLENPRAVEYLAQHGADLVTGLNATSLAELRAIIEQGISEGWSYNTIASAIRARFTDWARSRAELVAVQELASAYEAGNYLMASQLAASGLEIEKSNLTAGDDKVSDICLSAAADGWIALDKAFSSGTEHAPNHVRCRCATLYRMKPEEN